MTGPSHALSGARSILRDAGIDAGVDAAGHEHEILVVRARPALAPQIATLAPALKRLGFRYITVDLRGTVNV